jgi:serine/threonine-protein kinase
MEGESRLTLTGIAVGTPAYMSPEQATGDREIDGRSDVYALAIVGYQMLAGELPFQASNTPSMLMKHISEPPRPLREVRRDVPPRLGAAVERAMAKRPADRWPDANAFRDALAAAEDGPADAWTAREDAAPDRLSAAWKRPALVSQRVNPDPPHRDAAAYPREALGAPLGLVAKRPARDAVEAANAASGLPPIPAWMPASWREARRQWGPALTRRQYREIVREQKRSARDSADGSGLSEEDRIRAFRRKTASTAITIAVLFFINAGITHGDPWFLIPSAFLGFGWLRRASGLWADGISIRRIFGRKARQALTDGPRAVAPARASTAAELALALAPLEVLEGPYGAVVRGAATDRAAGKDALGKLTAADRELIPDVAPTLDALAERVASIAQSLHRMDEDITPRSLADLERRLEEAKRQPESAERDQRTSLLERQRSTTADLLKRRDTLRSQMESAALMLQSLRLDLLALRSAGVQSVIDDVSSATQEARALSRDIANALAAAKEIR